MSVFEQIAKFKVVPVIAIESPDAALSLADALLAGTLPIAEITFRTEAAAAVIRKMTQERPNLLVGAGTILTPDNLKAAVDSGAAFGVAPGCNPKIIEAAQKMNFPFVPGVCTPSDVEAALSNGCKILKFFPAGAMGGLTMLKALIAPYGNTGVQFMPTGGVSPDNLNEYLSTKGVIACGGTWIATKDDIASGKWELIASRCREVATLVSKL
ncbi:MAG: bifunctional 4-hydroxy-2-oxoglutarate aldolase/2-dehydro-3-deoxy-phosphogluconate aldolase [Planctomycetaceae bacterium]|nr:bifunctional 4-hydroxy-2-oxoglutarate aldolase/2-dehydro-3-deoxy-phosphogluconate aldolase [Planctomycetaceae bacterium]